MIKPFYLSFPIFRCYQITDNESWTAVLALLLAPVIVAVCVFLVVELSKNVLLPGNGGEERQPERKKQLQLSSATQPAGIFFFFLAFSSPVCSSREECCLCLPDSCMLHVPVSPAPLTLTMSPLTDHQASMQFLWICFLIWNTHLDELDLRIKCWTFY